MALTGFQVSLPLACNSVTGSTDLSYRLVQHNNTQQPELEILTRDCPVYSRAHTDEATVSGAKRVEGLLELAEGECWQFGRERGETKSIYVRFWLLYVVAESSG